MRNKNIKKYIMNVAILTIAGLSLAACQTTAKVYPLKKEDVRTYSLQSVNVSVSETANIAWERYGKNLELIDEGKPVTMAIPRDDIVEASSTSSSSDNFSVSDEPIVENKSPRFKKVEKIFSREEYKKAAIIEPLQLAIKSNFSDFMLGNRPVRAEVEIDSVRIAKSSGVNYLQADFKLMDVGTNSVILELENKTIAYQPAGGRGGYYYGNPLGIALAVVVKAAAQAAISQIGKDGRVYKMSEIYAASVRDSMAPDLKPKN